MEKDSSIKIFAIVHFFYKKQWNEIKQLLFNIAKYDNIELFATIGYDFDSYISNVLPYNKKSSKLIIMYSYVLIPCIIHVKI